MPEPTTEATQPTVTVTTPIPGKEYVYSAGNSTWIFGETEDSIILPILLVMLGVGSLLSNGLIIGVTLAFRRMRTGSNLMLLNIALSDLVFMLFCIPTAIINHVDRGNQGTDAIPGLGLCKFVHYIIFVTVYVSIYSLVVSCVFRFFGECMSDRSRTTSLLSRGNAIISAVVIWVAFLMSHINFLIQPDGAIFQEPFICLHSELLTSDGTKVKTLWVTFLTCAFLVPMVTICALSAITLHRQRHKRPPRPPNGQPHNYESAQNYINEKRNKRELALVVMATMVLRAVCWFPIQIFVMVDIFGVSIVSEVYRKAEMIGVCCAFAATCVNPMLYNCLSTDFRHAFHEAFRQLGCGCCISDKSEDEYSDMNETIMSIISDSSNHINYT